MKITLSHRILLYRFDAFAEIAPFEPRPELQWLCAAADDDGVVRAEHLRDALPGLTEVGADNILAAARDLGLVGRDGHVTTLGIETASTGRAPVPELGVYRFAGYHDPLLGHGFATVARISATAWHAADAMHNRPLRLQANEAIALPDGRRIVYRNGGARATAEVCRLQPNVTVLATATVVHDEPVALELAATGPGSEDAAALVAHPPEAAVALRAGELRDRVLAEVTEGAWQGTWLAVAWTGITSEERTRFVRKKVAPPEPVIIDGVRWSITRIVDVPIGPDSDACAQMWADERFEARLAKTTGPLSRRTIADLYVEAVEDTVLAGFDIEAPAHDRIVARDDTPEWFWRTQAPVDLAPAPVSPERLTARRLRDLTTDAPMEAA